MQPAPRYRPRGGSRPRTQLGNRLAPCSTCPIALQSILTTAPPTVKPYLKSETAANPPPNDWCNPPSAETGGDKKTPAPTRGRNGRLVGETKRAVWWGRDHTTRGCGRESTTSERVVYIADRRLQYFFRRGAEWPVVGRAAVQLARGRSQPERRKREIRSSARRWSPGWFGGESSRKIVLTGAPSRLWKSTPPGA